MSFLSDSRIWVLVLAVGWALWARRGVLWKRGGGNKRGGTGGVARVSEIRGLVGDLVQIDKQTRSATAAAEAFDLEFSRTFAGRESSPGQGVRRLFVRRACLLTALNEIRMRLPNDLTLERKVDALITDADRAMLGHIEDARQRTGAPLLHPGQAGDAWYGQWYRAYNDDMK